MTEHDPRELVTHLFRAWSGGDPDQVAALFHPDAVFFDSVNGRFTGRDAIRAFYAGSLDTWDDLQTRPVRIWVDGDTAACVWTMSGRIKNDRFGPGRAGSTARIDGMAWIKFRDGLVIHDEEYFDRQAAALSLDRKGVPPSETFSS